MVVLHELVVTTGSRGPRWVRRFLIAVILLVLVASVIGAVVSIVEGDPIERASGRLATDSK